MFLILLISLFSSNALAYPQLVAKLESTNHEHLDTSLLELFPELSQITRAGIERCFESINDDKSSNSSLFEVENTLKHVLHEYYAHFSDHHISPFQIDNLIKSLGFIVKHVVECSKEAENEPKTETFKIGLTSMSDISMKTYKRPTIADFLEGLRTTTEIPDSNFYEWGQCEQINIPDRLIPRKYDFRHRHPEFKKVSNQGQCNACWAFATAGIVQGAYLNAGYKVPKLSSQYLLDFSNENLGCNGGWGFRSLQFVKDHGIALDVDYPYVGYKTHNRNPGGAIPVKDFCYTTGKTEELDRIKQLLKHGPLWFAMISNDPKFQNYKSGIYSSKLEYCGDEDGWHAMTLVGYTEDAWIVRNTWGKRWGVDGFVYIKRGVNTCNGDSDSGYVIL